VAFLEDRLYLALSNLKNIQKPLIGWKKAGPPKSHFYFGCCVVDQIMFQF